MDEQEKPQVIVLHSGETEIAISPFGGKIRSLVIKGNTIADMYTRFDGKEGVTHPCSPNFRYETVTDYGLPQHGPARSSHFHIENVSENHCTLSLPIVGGTYPSGVILKQDFLVDKEGCTITATHTNTGLVQAPVNFGEHWYFDTPNGWEGIRVNGKEVTESIKHNATIALAPVSKIEIPGGESFTLTVSGLPLACFWAGFDGAAFDSTYVCIEPIEGDPLKDYFGSPSSMLNPGKSRTVSMRIS